MIYTFYSYKGGVGRTMALANVGELFYRAGLNVAMVDWDLEAPGLERFFASPSGSSTDALLDRPGVIDMLLEYKQQMTEDLPRDGGMDSLPFEKPAHYLVNLYPDVSREGSLSLIPAGRRSKDHFPEYAEAVLRFDWNDFYETWGGELYFEWLRRQLNQTADVVLIDSRTGVSEMGGVCTYQLADAVIILCGPNNQNLDGAYAMARNFQRPEVVDRRNGRPLDVLVVPARVEQSEGEALNRFQEAFLRHASRLAPSLFRSDPKQLWSLAIPYVPYYAYNEIVAVREPDKATARPMVQAFEELVQALVALAPVRSPIMRARREAPLSLRQLRSPVADFVGRENDIERLVQVFSQIRGQGTSARIGTIRGLGGIGKTELAYAVAERLKPIFPDAQLLVELHGSSETPTSPTKALQTIIRAFDPFAQPPDDLGTLQSLYRSLLSGKRVLILADDARDVTQVRPLLPPTNCALLITSRQRFTLPGMNELDLEVLPHRDAESLLLTICPRIDAQVVQLVELCGGLPLALRVSASVLAQNPQQSVEGYVHALMDERSRLAQLRDPDDPTLDVEVSVALSYGALDLITQSVLCQLTVFPARFDLSAATAVVALPDVRPTVSLEGVISTLYRHSLIQWDSISEHYSLHDLVRVFAAARLDNADAVALRHARYYAHVAAVINDLYLRGDQEMRAALTQFDQERVNIDSAWNWLLHQPPSTLVDELLVEYAIATADIGDLRYDARI